MSHRDDGTAWADQGSINESSSYGRYATLRHSPFVRRNLYDGPDTPGNFDLTSELLSVREESAILSSRALIEGLSPSQGPPLSPGFDEPVQGYYRDSPGSYGLIEEEQLPADLLAPGPGPDSPAPAGGAPGSVSGANSYHHQASTGHGAASHVPSVYEGSPPQLVSHKRHEPPTLEKLSALTEIWNDFTLLNTAKYTPSVLLGVLLNILDGLSYGMILFPVSEPVFAGLESAGLSLFYVSTVVAQLVFSLGASRFQACVGSEMIEIVPFFHAIAYTIAQSIGEEHKEDVLATTITAFAISAIITGAVFFLLGYFGLGAMVGFFPRHILVGCIGGVGWFLIATGFEVSTRMKGSLEYNKETLMFLLEPDVLAKWGSCCALAVVLLVVERKVPSALAVPGLLIFTFILFHIIVALVPELNLELARDAGWVFAAQKAEQPWYEVYTLFRFNKVHWGPILESIPAMLALTFFGLIHVPINIPALAAATKNDDVDVNQELIAHGISNTLSGMVGSIQNYLVYTNSVMFIKSGADSKFSGLLLSFATFGVMIAGPGIIGYIPVIVVGSLIFMMGCDLVGEALIDTIGKVDRQEYITIVAIVVTMGGYDFVIGILVGIVLACMSFVINSARQDPFTATYTGETARSTVNRQPTLQKFLSRVGTQIHIVKLQGSLFFGTNVQIETGIKSIIENDSNPIKYLIIDLERVTDIDWGSADTFARMKRWLDARGVSMILSGAHQFGPKVRGLRAVDLVQDNNEDAQVHLFSDLNLALEFCENQFLATYYKHRDMQIIKSRPSMNLRGPRSIPGGISGGTGGVVSTETTALSTPRPRKLSISGGGSYGAYGVTPRATSLRIAAEHIVNEDLQAVSKWHQFQQPMPLLMQVVHGISDKDPDFWFRAVPFFTRTTARAGEILSEFNVVSPGFFLIESGILHNEFQGGKLTETVLAGTTFGELSFFTDGKTSTRVTAETDVVLWKMSKDKFHELQELKDSDELVAELLKVSLSLTRVRFSTMSSYLQVLSA